MAILREIWDHGEPARVDAVMDLLVEQGDRSGWKEARAPVPRKKEA